MSGEQEAIEQHARELAYQRENGVPALILVDSDLQGAFMYNSARPSSPIVEILATVDGCNDYADWHWLAMLESGRFAYITGGCDYTGWDCQSNLDVHEADTLAECVRLVPEVERDKIAAQLPERSCG